MEFLAEYGMFFAKVATVVVAILLIIGGIASASHKQPPMKEGVLQVKKLNDKLEQMEHAVRASVMDSHALKVFEKKHRAEEKKQAKQRKKAAASKPGDGDKHSDKGKDTSQPAADAAQQKSVFVIDFDGDIKASAAEHLREEITAILTMATKDDEVVVVLESPGGMVHAYGLAASQIARIRSAGIPLTICVDKVAASGGYMMACIANKLLAAPFAVLGSIGVVASIPNFNKVLKKHDVDYELLTAGEYKRTLTMLGENTEEGRKKFVSDLEETHKLFKQFVSEYRPQLDIASVATGETWYGKQALDKQLIDEISTSDEYVNALAKDCGIFQVKYTEKKNWQERLGMAAESALVKSFDRALASVLGNWLTRH
ncbi:MAG: protease SohB [Gammaproteobacteria bacterium]|nr:protease SohB [Gammaproteobacteria bacterium]